MIRSQLDAGHRDLNIKDHRGDILPRELLERVITQRLDLDPRLRLGMSFCSAPYYFTPVLRAALRLIDGSSTQILFLRGKRSPPFQRVLSWIEDFPPVR